MDTKITLIQILYPFEFSNIRPKHKIKRIGKVKIKNVPAGFKVRTYRCAFNALTNGATLLCNNFGKEKKRSDYNWFYCLLRSQIRYNMEVFHTTSAQFIKKKKCKYKQQTAIFDHSCGLRRQRSLQKKKIKIHNSITCIFFFSATPLHLYPIKLPLKAFYGFNKLNVHWHYLRICVKIRD